MKITPVTGPGAVQDLSTPEHVRTAKMLAGFNKGATSPTETPTRHEHPVADPNNISPEEMSAVQSSEASEETQESNTDAVLESTEEDKPKVDPELDKRFQLLARQERALRAKIHQQNLEYKQREEALKSREQALTQPREVDLSQYIPRERLKADPLAALEEAQVSWDELTQQAVNRQPTDPRVMSTIQKLEAKIAQMEQAQEDNKKSHEQQQQDQYQAALRQIRADVKQTIYTDPEFETVKAMNATKDVVELIEETFKKDGIVLSVEEACREVENYLVDEAMKITQIDKIKKRLAESKASTLKTETKPQTEPKQTQMKTLTNATSSSRKLSVRERAIARANGFNGDF